MRLVGQFDQDEAEAKGGSDPGQDASRHDPASMTAPPSPPLPPSPPARSRRRWMKRAGLVGLFLIVVAVTGVWVLMRMAPEHWQEHRAFVEANPPSTVKQVALDAEARLREITLGGIERTRVVGDYSPETTDRGRKLTEVRVDRRSELKLTLLEINAILDQYLGDWIKQRGYTRPKWLGDTVVDYDENNGLAITFEVLSPTLRQLLTLRFDLQFLPNGEAQTRLKSLHAGKMPVPLRAVELVLAKGLNREDAAKAAEWFARFEQFTFKPVLELEYRRRMRLLGLQREGDHVIAEVQVQDYRTYREMNQELATVMP